MCIATLTEHCASVEGMETVIPDTNCKLGLASSINPGHLIFKNEIHNEILKLITAQYMNQTNRLSRSTGAECIVRNVTRYYTFHKVSEAFPAYGSRC
jgi:hypothetical protein